MPTSSEVRSLIDQNIKDNQTKYITPARLRGTLVPIMDWITQSADFTATNVLLKLPTKFAAAQNGLLTDGASNHPMVTSATNTCLIVYGDLATNIGWNSINSSSTTHSVTIGNGKNRTAVFGMYNNAGTLLHQYRNNGNVSIGYSSPTDAGYRFDVSGTARFTGQVYNSSGGLRTEGGQVIGWHNGGQGLRFGFVGNFGGTAYRDAFYPNNPSSNGSGQINGIYFEHAATGHTYIRNVSYLDALVQVKVGRDNQGGGTLPNDGVLVSGEQSGTSNLQGSSLYIRAGRSTGSYAGAIGNVHIETSDATSPGSASQVYTSKIVAWKNGSVSIGSAALHASAKFEVQSVTRGAIFAPKMTEVERDAIPSPIEGLGVYNLTVHKYQFHNGTSWTDL